MTDVKKWVNDQVSNSRARTLIDTNQKLIDRFTWGSLGLAGYTNSTGREEIYKSAVQQLAGQNRNIERAYKLDKKKGSSHRQAN